MSFVGDKIWNEDEYFSEIHREHHINRTKDEVLSRQDSNLSQAPSNHNKENLQENLNDNNKNENQTRKVEENLTLNNENECVIASRIEIVREKEIKK